MPVSNTHSEADRGASPQERQTGWVRLMLPLQTRLVPTLPRLIKLSSAMPTCDAHAQHAAPTSHANALVAHGLTRTYCRRAILGQLRAQGAIRSHAALVSEAESEQVNLIGSARVRRDHTCSGS